jgi:CRP-like cAMP-binding protein
VNWFNAVDDTYRNELRSLNEVNFAQFDAKLEQRFAERDAQMERRIAQLGAKIDGIASRFEIGIAQQNATIERTLKEHTRWMFVAWASMMLTIVGFGIRG